MVEQYTQDLIIFSNFFILVFWVILMIFFFGWVYSSIFDIHSLLIRMRWSVTWRGVLQIFNKFNYTHFHTLFSSWWQVHTYGDCDCHFLFIKIFRSKLCSIFFIFQNIFESEKIEKNKNKIDFSDFIQYFEQWVFLLLIELPKILSSIFFSSLLHVNNIGNIKPGNFLHLHLICRYIWWVTD